MPVFCLLIPEVRGGRQPISLYDQPTGLATPHRLPRSSDDSLTSITTTTRGDTFYLTPLLPFLKKTFFHFDFFAYFKRSFKKNLHNRLYLLISNQKNKPTKCVNFKLIELKQLHQNIWTSGKQINSEIKYM